MDKVKLVLKFLKRQHFWMICVAVLGLGIYCWHAADSAMSAQFTKFKSEIENRKNQAAQIVAVKSHANAIQHKGQDELIAAAQKSVLTAWGNQYQRQGDVLVWPKALTADFIAEVEKRRPIEEKGDMLDMPGRLREMYRDFIRKELPKLAERNGIEWTASLESSAGGGAGGLGGPGRAGGPFGGEIGAGPVGPGPGGAVDPKDKSKSKAFMVPWEATDQARWVDHFNYSKEKDSRPTTVQIMYAQEDLWVLDTVLRMVKRINGEVDDRHLPKIAALNFVKVGKDARTLLGVVKVAQDMSGEAGPGGAVPGAGPVGQGAVPPPNMRAMEGGRGPVGAGPPAPGAPVGPAAPGMANNAVVADPNHPAEERYVDENYKPITAERLKSIGKTKDQSDAHLAVAKRIPVRMQFRMDVRSIPQLLGECANADLTIEIRQLRYNPRGDSGGGNAGPGGAGPIGRGGEGPGAFPVGGNVPGGANAQAQPNVHEGIVELYGIVYIYNPVNYAKLGLDEEKDKDKIEGDKAKGDSKADPKKDAKDTAAGKDAAKDAAKPADAGKGVSGKTDKADAGKATDLKTGETKADASKEGASKAVAPPAVPAKAAPAAKGEAGLPVPPAGKAGAAASAK